MNNISLNRSKRINLDKTSIKKSKTQYFPENAYFSSQNNIDINSLKTCELINKYIDNNSKGSKLIKENKNSKALSYYEKASLIADELKDEFKKNESNCNLAIAYYNSNNIQKAIKILQSCYKYCYGLCSSEDGSNDIKNLTMLCKAGANLCICQIALNFNNDYNCIKLIDDIINIISNEEDITVQFFCLKYLNNILFGVNSLLSSNENILSKNMNLEEDEDEDEKSDSFEENQEKNNEIYQLLFDSFKNFIATQRYDSWINSLDIIIRKMQKLKYDKGLINVLFNQHMAECLKNMENEIKDSLNGEQEAFDPKLKLASLLTSCKQANDDDNEINNNNNGNETQINDEYINSIIEEYKAKLNIIRDIYNKLALFEKQINNNLNNSQNDIINTNYYKKNISNKYNYDQDSMDEFSFNINSKYFLIILLKYTISYFESNIEDEALKTSLIKNISKALNSINNFESSGLDFYKLNLSSLDPQLCHYIKNKFKNLFKTYRKMKLKNAFDAFKNNEDSSSFNTFNINNKNFNNNDLNNNNYNNKIILNSSNKFSNFNNNSNNAYNNKNTNNEIILENFFEECYNFVYKGGIIEKINFRTNGSKKHYYKVDYKSDMFRFFPDANSKESKKDFEFDNIIKIKIGIITNNVKSKIDKVKSCLDHKSKPYRFMSFIFKDDKTLDFVFQDGKSAKSWFYGLFYFFEISSRPYKMHSCSKYILMRLKWKMINKLKMKIGAKGGKSFAYYMKKYNNQFLEKKYTKLNDN